MSPTPFSRYAPASPQGGSKRAHLFGSLREGGREEDGKVRGKLQITNYELQITNYVFCHTGKSEGFVRYLVVKSTDTGHFASQNSGMTMIFINAMNVPMSCEYIAHMAY